MAVEKLLAEWFWTDRWMGSSAFLLPLEARGLYREMLTQAWRRGARLPNDHEAIQRAVGCTKKEWSRSWLTIEKYWRVEGDHLVNDTQLEVYRETVERMQRVSARAKRGGHARAQAQLKHNLSTCSSTAQAPLGHVLAGCTPSPSPSPYVVPAELLPRRGHARPMELGLHRLKFWRWMAEAFIDKLGTHADGFDIEAWVCATDRLETRVIQGDWWAYWLPAFEAEVRRRGLPVVALEGPRMFKEPTQADADLQLEMLRKSDAQRERDRAS